MSSSFRRPASRIALVAVAVASAWGCATAPRAAAPTPLGAETARFLLDPSAGLSGPADRELTGLFERLLAGEPAERLRAELERLDGGPAHQLLASQIEFVAGQHDASRRRLETLAPEAHGSDAARLLSARLADLAGDPLLAYALYDGLADRSAAAAERRSSLRESAAEAVLDRVDRALDERDLDAAAAALERLERIEPDSPRALERAAAVARARGDAVRELAAVRALAAGRPDELTLQIRRGELEVEAGDAAAGLALLERLAVEHPVAAVAAALDRAKFAYRLANAPEAVRRIAAKPLLTRGEFARLLYWLTPSVRTARPGATRIATDLIDHPAREELVRVANLGLLQIDEALHRFDPDRGLTRGEAFAALARLAGTTASPANGCTVARRQGWIAPSEECREAMPVSGREATGWLRVAGSPGEPAP